jgi:hypothetical protein
MISAANHLQLSNGNKRHARRSSEFIHMNRLSTILLTLLIIVGMYSSLTAQTDTAGGRPRIAIFTPLYLDSAFDASGNYRYSKNFPRLFNPGLDFLEGTQLAIDSLNKENAQLDIDVYDSRSASGNIRKITESESFTGTDMIIAHVNMADAQWLAHVAGRNKIPFINVNFPNEAGVTENPNYIVLNSTLYTHCEGIYKFIQKNFALAPIVVFRKKGAQEDRLKEYFTGIEKKTSSVPLKLKFVTLEDNFMPQQLTAHMNSEKTTVCVVASLDLNFAARITQQLAGLNSTTHASVVMGMPTWDAINFTGQNYKDLEIMYSTPFYIAASDSGAARIATDFFAKYYSRPTDMVYRGYETVYHFAHLLLNRTGAASNFNDERYKIFYNFDIQPVINPKTNRTDYLENKKLYFVKKVDGVIRIAY